MNAFKYVCGYLVNKCLKIYSCDICEVFSRASATLDCSNLFLHLKAFDKENTAPFGKLRSPHESFYNFIYYMKKVFFENFEQFVGDHPGNNI